MDNNLSDFTLRVFHGTPTEWQTNRPLASKLGQSTGVPWYGGEFYASPYIDEPLNFYMNLYEDINGKSGQGNVYSFDINPKEFYDVNKPFNKQSPLVQEAITKVTENSPTKLFTTEKELTHIPKIHSSEWNELMDSLYPHGVKGVYITPEDTTPEYVFRYAKDVPTVYNTKRGTDILTTTQLENKSQIPTKQIIEAKPNFKKIVTQPSLISTTNKSISNLIPQGLKPIVKNISKAAIKLSPVVDIAAIAEGLYQMSIFNPKNREYIPSQMQQNINKARFSI